MTPCRNDMVRTLDTKCEISDSEEQTVSEVAGIKEEQLEVDIKIEHAGDGEQNFEDFEAENSDVDSVKEELSDDDNFQENEVSDRKKSPQEFCGRCKKNISKSLFTSHLESCHPNNEDFQVKISTLKIFKCLSDVKLLVNWKENLNFPMQF